MQSKRRSYQLFAIIYFKLQFFITNIPDLKVLFICYFTFCWIRIRNNNSGSGSRQKFLIHADPDPQH